MKTKKILFLTSFCLITYSISIKAQITVDSTDYASVGDTIIRANDTVPPVGISVLGFAGGRPA